MDIKRFQSFQKVASSKSFSKAARDLFLSQPTITSHISELEKEFDITLFNRSRKGIELTHAGTIFLTYVNQFMNLYNGMLESFNSIKSGREGSFKFSFSGTVCYWIVSKLDVFRSEFPNVEIRFDTSYSDVIINAVINRDTDIGIIRRLASDFSHPLLETAIVESDAIIPVISTKHRLARLSKLRLSDICRENLLIYGKNAKVHQELIARFNNAGFFPKSLIEISDYQTAKLFVQQFGVCFLPEIAINAEIIQGKLKKLCLIDYKPIKMYSILIYRKDLPLTNYLKKFISILNPSK